MEMFPDNQLAVIEAKFADDRAGLVLHVRELSSETTGIEPGRYFLNVAEMFRMRAKYHFAKWLNEEAFRLFEVAGDRREMANSLHNLALAHQNLSEFDEAIRCYSQALELDKEGGDESAIATTYDSLALAHSYKGEVKQAIVYHRKALAIFEEKGMLTDVAQTRNNLGIALSKLGQHARALELHEQALAYFVEKTYLPGAASALQNIGTCHFSLGDNILCLEYLEKSLAIHRHLKNKHGIARCCSNQCLALSALGRYFEALQKNTEALFAYTEIGSITGVAGAHGNAADIYYFLGDVEKAQLNHKKQLELHQKTGAIYGQAIAHNGLGTCYADEGSWHKAEEHYLMAIDLNKIVGSVHLESTAYINLGNLFYHQQNYGKSEYYLKLALRLNSDQVKSKSSEMYIFNTLGNVAKGKGQLKKAESYFKKGLEIATNAGEGYREQMMLGNLSLIYFQMGRRELSYSFGKKTIEKSELLLNQILVEENLISFGASLTKVFNFVILLAIENGKHAESYAYLEKAKSKALVRLLSLFTSRPPDSKMSTPELEDLYVEEESLLGKIRHYYQRQQIRPNMQEMYAQQVIDMNAALDSIRKKISALANKKQDPFNRSTLEYEHVKAYLS